MLKPIKVSEKVVPQDANTFFTPILKVSNVFNSSYGDIEHFSLNSK